MSTPEGKVKRKVSALLKQYDCLFYTMPVPSGFGESTLDYIGCHYGRFFAIETKAAGKKPTPRQDGIIEQIRAAGGKAFVVAGDEGFDELKRWLDI